MSTASGDPSSPHTKFRHQWTPYERYTYARPARAEHRDPRRREPLVAVACGIADGVRLDLDDAAADAVDEQRDAHELGRDLVHGPREEVRR